MKTDTLTFMKRNETKEEIICYIVLRVFIANCKIILIVIVIIFDNFN